MLNLCNNDKSSNVCIPTEIREKISQIKFEGKPYAAFDLDNTLLIGDVGEAVFASLIKMDLHQGFNWQDYRNLLNQNREEAYKRVVEIMDGLEPDTLKNITYEVLKPGNLQIEIDADTIPCPRPNVFMQALILFLQGIGLDVFVVTASNQISAEIVCQEYFNLPSSSIFGAPVSFDINGKISYKHAQIPYGIGKVNVLKKKFNYKPGVTGGDGIWDKFLLDYTSDNGVRFWLGHDTQEYRKLKEECYPDKNFYHIQYQQYIHET